MQLCCLDYHLTSATVFTKLASQLTADKLSDLAVIPLIFIVQTLISYVAALLVSKICRFKKRASNFVVAMAVCPASPFYDVVLTTLGIWKLKLTSHFPHHLTGQNTLWPTLGQDPW